MLNISVATSKFDLTLSLATIKSAVTSVTTSETSLMFSLTSFIFVTSLGKSLIASFNDCLLSAKISFDCFKSLLKFLSTIIR